MNESKLAEGRLDRVADRACRLAAAARPHDLPEHRVVDVTAAVVPDRRADRLGHAVDAANQILGALRRQLGRLLERRVQVGDVGRVMLAVMDPHRLLVDVRLQRVVVVWEGRDFVGHSLLLQRSAISSQAVSVSNATVSL